MPDAGRLAATRIIAHRGERDGVRVKENTIAAFDAALAAGADAIEFDVRYTADDEPVVVHDADLRRVFDRAEVIADIGWARLHERVPEIPHLEDVVARYGERCHLMIELKTRGPAEAERRLHRALAARRPQRDFHLLSLEVDLFAAVAELPGTCHLPVAKLNTAALYDWALNNDCAGLAGPWALMTNTRVEQLLARRGFAGTGFIATPALLRREIARGIDWLFTDHAARLCRARAAWLETVASAGDGH